MSCLEATALAERIRACEACPVSRTTTQRVPGIGPLDAKVVVLARNPGRDEDRKGEPLVGRAGQFFDRMMRNGFGLERSDLGLVNIVNCFTPDNRPPNTEEIRNCARFREEQLLFFHQKVLVLAMGREAIEATIGEFDGGVEAVLGRLHRPLPLPIRGHVAWGVIPMFHPSFLLRDLDRSREFARNEAPGIRALIEKTLDGGVPWGQSRQRSLFE